MVFIKANLDKNKYVKIDSNFFRPTDIEFSNLDPLIFAVGNKYDKPTKIDVDMIKKFCSENEIYNINVSAKTNQNITELFDMILEKALEFEKYSIPPPRYLNIEIKSKNRKCCY